jgi:hypothetical protein
MKIKLDDEEYQALLNMFSNETLNIRRTSNQSMFFRFNFYLINTYAAAIILIYFLISNYFTGAINPQLVESNYETFLGRRAIAFLWIISAFNLSFYFGMSFRFVSTIALMYVLNATFDQFLIMYAHYNATELPIFSIFFFSRPILIIALIFAIKTYKDA